MIFGVPTNVAGLFLNPKPEYLFFLFCLDLHLLKRASCNSEFYLHKIVFVYSASRKSIFLLVLLNIYLSAKTISIKVLH